MSETKRPERRLPCLTCKDKKGWYCDCDTENCPHVDGWVVCTNCAELPNGRPKRVSNNLCDWAEEEIEGYVMALEDHATTLETRLAASEKRAEWQDISTAPKDGTRILLHWPKWDVVIAGSVYEGMEDTATGETLCRYWVTDNDLCIEDGPDDTPDLWVPLPSPPAREAVNKLEGKDNG